MDLKEKGQDINEKGHGFSWKRTMAGQYKEDLCGEKRIKDWCDYMIMSRKR